MCCGLRCRGRLGGRTHVKIAVVDIARAKRTQWGRLARGLPPCMHAWGQRWLATMRWSVSVRRHAGIRDIIWFRSFVPENDGEYVGALLLCFFVGVFASALRVWRGALETSERIARNKVWNNVAVALSTHACAAPLRVAARAAP